MANNWTIADAAKAIHEKDTVSIQDIGTRFPLAANLMAQLNDAGATLFGAVPDIITVRKVESILKGELSSTDTEDEDEKPKGKKKATKEDEKPKGKKEVVIEEDDDFDFD